MDKPAESEAVAEELDASLSDLRFITRRLQRYGFFTLLVSVLNFATVILSLSVRFLPVSFIVGIVLVIYLPILLTVVATIFIVRYESLRKRGDALFEEISDELQWNVLNKTPKIGPAAEDRPMLNARVALRSFARATDLPLIPGKYGPGIYATVNFLMSFLAIYLFRALNSFLR